MVNGIACFHGLSRPLRYSLKHLRLIVLASLGLAIVNPSPVLASPDTPVPIGHPEIPGTMIACFDKSSGRYVDKIHPAWCDIAGYASESGGRFAATSVKGIQWGGWGQFRSKGARGVNTRNGIRVRVWAYRRVNCGDGRTFYSSANVVNLENGAFYLIRLPVCDSPTPRH
jgi:hypothetical protein